MPQKATANSKKPKKESVAKKPKKVPAAPPLEITLWNAAKKLRGSVESSEYKHIVLGLVFLKYISDSFMAKRQELTLSFKNPESEHYMGDLASDENAIAQELEVKDYYEASHVFWVPEESRWEKIQASAKLSNIGKIVDDALLAIENDNKKLKGVLNKSFSNKPSDKVGSLIDLITNNISFDSTHVDQDIFGRIYEYFLGEFALAEGQGAGAFYTPHSMVKLMIHILNPTKGRMYDPCFGAGGMLVQARQYVKSQGGDPEQLSIYGQELTEVTWKLAAMNLSIRNIDFNLGVPHKSTLTDDCHPNLLFDYTLSNPPYNQKEWVNSSTAGDKRWKWGTPGSSNANFAWIQHIAWHMSSTGQAGIVMANGSMTSTANGDDKIRQKLVEDDLVEIMIALPSNMFINTTIPACLWFLAKDKTINGRSRKGETLFIDTRKMGFMKTRKLREFSDADVKQIVDTINLWRAEPSNDEGAAKYENIPGFCQSVSFDKIKENGFILTPGRYVGTVEEEESEADSFEKVMPALVAELKTKLEEGDALVASLKEKLGELGYVL